jgi:small subunit ribosomal protein S20
MANLKSAIKRIRSNDKRRLRNRYHAKTMRNALKQFALIENKKEAEEKLSGMVSMIDKLAKRSVIHKNKATNLKSKLTKKLNKMA